MTYTISDCKAARAACERLMDEAQSQVMRNYWRDVHDMWNKRERGIEGDSLKQLAKVRAASASCPIPYRYGHDEMRCNECHIIWDIRDDKPPCPKKKGL